ncbi:hypothetical protein KPL40_12255 [Clostridium gasigenes]|uniref:rRNA adenine N-6-methyltransferase family protein n=1 Tax=Clostridium gasigenes TaxID=94869 RepID=UPI001C0C6C7C|nr:rRNA adenine N-6-methyltransferase family protein [Clostridium gasigenes]MBU3133222.1 hypothetical protein [Clostridium gasigenes]
MKPYNKKYVLDVITEYNNKIKIKKVGDFEIKKNYGIQGIVKGYMYEIEDGVNIDILELQGPDNVWMRLTPLEIESSYMPIRFSKGKVGLVGLGLGYVAQEMAKRKEVKEVIVYEIDQDVIDLYNNSFNKNKKIKILCEDAFKAESNSFDFFYVDIYEYKLTKKVVEDYKILNSLHKIEEYSFWGMEHFLLSCRYEEIVWVYIPENWMAMTKLLSERLEESGYIKHYKALDEKLVSEVIADFKIVLE